MRLLFILFIFHILCTPFSIAAAYEGIVINEILAANTSTNLDQRNYNFGDWIELYNSTDEPQDLRSCYLTDDPFDLKKWRIIRARMAPKSHTLIWADAEPSIDHSNFKLNQTGEFIALVSKDGEIIDSLFYPAQMADVSYGRSPDASSIWRYFMEPTPNAPNLKTGEISLNRIAAPVASLPAGFYDQRVRVTLDADADAQIHYTLDGSLPTLDSPLYQRRLVFSQTSVLRARAFSVGRIPSRVVTHTYLIGEQVALPVVSLAAEPDHFFDDEIGIYVDGSNGTTGNCSDDPRNWNQDWERPVSVEFFETDGAPGFTLDAGVKIYGGCSRQRDRRSLAIFAREKYGAAELAYPLFPDKPIQSFQSFVLRNSGNDAEHTLIRDGLMQATVKGQLDIDYQSFRPAVVFLNGEYWGLYNIREKINEHYAASNHGVAPDQVDLLYNDRKIFSGEKDHYEALRLFLLRNDLADADTYRWVKTQMDINEYINYQIAQIYFSNTDWPSNNLKYWRPHTPSGRWRWILFDTDFGFGLKDNGLSHNTLAFALDPNETGWPNPAWSTLLFRKLIRNDEFKQTFIQRFTVCLQAAFEPARVMDLVESFSAQIAAEIPRHISRWDAPDSLQAWQNKISGMNTFARVRPRVIYRNLEREFDLNERIAIEIKTIGDGRVYVAGAPLFDGENQIELYADIPVTLRAVPLAGSRFVNWEPFDETHADKISLTPQSAQTISAVFEPGPSLVINEIHYHPFIGSGNQDYEYIELLNAGKTHMDLEGYKLSGGVNFIFPEEMSISPGDYLILAKDASLYPHLECQVLSWGDSKLANEGERIHLQGPMGETIDSVHYNSSSIWSHNADGAGFSLSLVDPNSDHDDPDNWFASPSPGGTPGQQNFQTPPTKIQDWMYHN
ncbi:MAG: CotH kinase family protein [Candidatus Hinthialibacter antarcticus]|nr:CotH kinase family protein [Candidatus Hinthialibacter antarcticus]